jgi:hypothetical protein
MEMTPADVSNAPVGFKKVWADLPSNIQLTLMRLWQAEQATTGANARHEITGAAAPAPLIFPVAHRQSS